MVSSASRLSNDEPLGSDSLMSAEGHVVRHILSACTVLKFSGVPKGKTYKNACHIAPEKRVLIMRILYSTVAEIY